MKSINCVFTLLLLFLFFANNNYSQKTRTNKTRKATISTSQLSPLTSKQKDFLQNLINVTDTLDTTFLTNPKNFANEAMLLVSFKDKIPTYDFPSSIQKQTIELINTYNDFSIFYGRISNTGIYNSYQSLQKSLGDNSEDIVVLIVQYYKLGNLTTAQAIQKMKSLALRAKNNLKTSLSKSPTNNSNTPTQNFKAKTEDLQNQSSFTNDNMNSEISLQNKNSSPTPQNLTDSFVGTWNLESNNTYGKKVVLELIVKRDGNLFYGLIKINNSRTQLPLSGIYVDDNNFKFILSLPTGIGQNYFETVFTGNIKDKNSITINMLVKIPDAPESFELVGLRKD